MWWTEKERQKWPIMKFPNDSAASSETVPKSDTFQSAFLSVFNLSELDFVIYLHEALVIYFIYSHVSSQLFKLCWVQNILTLVLSLYYFHQFRGLNLLSVRHCELEEQLYSCVEVFQQSVSLISYQRDIGAWEQDNGITANRAWGLVSQQGAGNTDTHWLIHKSGVVVCVVRSRCCKTLVVCQSVTTLISPCTQAGRADVLQHVPVHWSHPNLLICPSNQAVQSECNGATLSIAHMVLTEFKFELVSAVSHFPVLTLTQFKWWQWVELQDREML